MELQGSDAARWEQMSKILRELSGKISEYKTQLETVGEALATLLPSVESTQQTLDKLSSLADKEVLRQESGTLNVTDDYVAPQHPQPAYNIQEKVPQEASLQSLSAAEKQAKDVPVNAANDAVSHPEEPMKQPKVPKSKPSSAKKSEKMPKQMNILDGEGA